MLDGPIGITNTHSVGVVHDGSSAMPSGRTRRAARSGRCRSSAETWDGLLNDTNGFHVTMDHVDAALAAASDGPVAEGNVGGGTGMVCHEFKGGIGTASRLVPEAFGGWTVGVLVQANYGQRDLLRVDGVPVGEAIPVDEVPSPYRPEDDEGPSETAAPGLRLDHRDRGDGRAAAAPSMRAPGPASRPRDRADGRDRRATRAATCSSASRRATADLPGITFAADPRFAVEVRAVNDHVINGLFDAVIESTEEAILNALVAASTMTGRDGITAHAIPHDRLVEVMERYGRGPHRG